MRRCLAAVFVVGTSQVLGAAAVADLDLILYGADGCVGHFAASHLAQQPDLKWAIAGRNQSHLEAVAAALASEGGPSRTPEIIVAALGNESDPRAWVGRARAVITAAGPFSKNGGESLVQACAELGVHYSDTSDEFYWQREMVDRHDATAQRSGAKIALASGFCALAGDIGSSLAMGKLGVPPGAIISVDAWLESYNGGLSAGVINTGRALMNASYPKEWNNDPYVLAPTADSTLRVDTKVEGMSFPDYIMGEGLIVSNIFGPYDARLLRRSFTERNLKVNLRVGATSTMYPKWAAFLALHPGSWTKLTKCPNKAVYDGGSWAYRFKASATFANLPESSVLLSGKGDPGYHFTAWGLAEVGLCLANRTAGCAKGGAAGGVYTSMSALDVGVLSSRLQSIGLLEVKSPAEEDSQTTLVV